MKLQEAKDIKLGSTSASKVMLGDTQVWPSLSQWYGIRGTTNVTSTTLSDALYYNSSLHDVEVDENGNFSIEINDYVTAQKICRSSNITSIDLTRVKWSLSPSIAIDNLFDTGGNYTNLRDVYFDFSWQDSENIQGFWSLFRGLTGGCRIHGLGTLKWTGPIVKDAGKWKHILCLRELSIENISGTLDIRGIDTSSITDQPNSIWDESQYGLQDIYGYWYNFCGYGCYCDTWIVGNLEMHYIYTMSNASRCKTLYCTSKTPPSLNRTGENSVTAKNWLSKFTGLQNIYVPVGCLEAYQNADLWRERADIMSEKDAPDPLSI